MDTKEDITKNFDDDIDKANAIKRFDYDPSLEEIIWNLNIAAATTEKFMSIGITLIVGGVVLTGDLISSLEYFKRQADENKAVSDEDNENYEEYNARQFREIKEYILEKLDKKESPDFDFFHMKNSMIISGAMCSDKGFVWRGKISEVSAFSWQQVMKQNTRISVNSR